MKPGWVWHQFRERYGRKPPVGCTLPPEIAAPAQKAEALHELREQCRQRGYKPGWVVHRFRDRFGHLPGASP